MVDRNGKPAQPRPRMQISVTQNACIMLNSRFFWNGFWDRLRIAHPLERSDADRTNDIAGMAYPQIRHDLVGGHDPVAPAVFAS